MERGDENWSKKRGYFCTSNKCIVLVLFIIIAAMAAVAIITFFVPAVRGPIPEHKETLEWWKTSIIYQIYPRSFQDTNDDGVGDLQGITKRLDYLKDLNIGAIWLSPFYSSPMEDFGYDVKNYTEVDPLFGNMTDLENLIEEAHSKGIKVIVDFVPNHTSDKSQWFEMSRRAGKDDKYRDFYMWNPGTIGTNGQRQPPNNWQSVFGGSAWEFDTTRQEYYYHAFLKSQPDLNYRNPDVLEVMDAVLKFWLDKGVDGFRVDAIPHLFEARNVSQNEPKGANGANQHTMTKNREEIYDVVKRWSKLVKDYETTNTKTIALIMETTEINHEQRNKYYASGSVPFYFDLIGAKDTCGATSACYAKLIKDGTNLTEGNWPNFVMGNHDQRRIADSKGTEYVDAMNMMLLTLPGTPTTYYGEELGMRGGDYTGMPPKDPFAIMSHNTANSRDSERNPMQWDNSTNAGFSNSTTPWLPVTSNTNYKTVNVEAESKSGSSHLSIYKRLARFRQTAAFQNGDIEFPKSGTNDVLIYIRRDKTNRYLVTINLSVSQQSISILMPNTKGHIELSTRSRPNTDIDLSNISLEVGEGLIIKLVKTN